MGMIEMPSRKLQLPWIELATYFSMFESIQFRTDWLSEKPGDSINLGGEL